MQIHEVDSLEGHVDRGHYVGLWDSGCSFSIGFEILESDNPKVLRIFNLGICRRTQKTEEDPI